jgi:drug/metabolite transporter (DMT)-like permease
MTELWAVGLILFGSFLGAFGSVYFKLGADKLKFTIKDLRGNRDLMRGIIIYGASTLFYLIGIKGGELTVLFPLVSTGYVWMCLLSIKYLHERMNMLKWGGISCIVLGVVLIGLGQ